jgi:hypothetical protein
MFFPLLLRFCPGVMMPRDVRFDTRRVFFVAFVVAAIFLAKQYVPPLFSRFQFGDSVRQTVKYAAASQKDFEAIRREIVSAAADYEIPITCQGRQDYQARAYIQRGHRLQLAYRPSTT